MTYAELNALANQGAHYLRSQGVKPETRVCLSLEPSVDLIVVILAILKAGGAYVPLDAQHPKHRLQSILDDTQPRLLIIPENRRERFSLHQGEILTWENLQVQQATYPLDNPQPLAQAQHLAYVIFTSGSTGKPKGVLIEQGSLVNYCHWFAEYSACRYPQRLDFSSPIIFDMAVTTALLPLALGLSMVICPPRIKRDPAAYLRYLRDQQINLIKITPSYFKMLLHAAEDEPMTLEHLHTIILGGENLAQPDCVQWLQRYPQHQLINEYGPTEATVAVTCFKITKDSVADLPDPVPIGKAGGNMFCELDPDSGELLLGGMGLARGYLNQPSLTQERFPQHQQTRLYRSGDLARCLPDGHFQVLGRRDEQVKIRGYRIEPREIELCLKSHPAIKDAMVTTIQLKTGGELHLAAYYILRKESGAPSEAELRRYLSQYLADYLIPWALLPLAAFPINDNGKLDKKSLPLPPRQSVEKFIPPRTTLEKNLAQIWIQELHLEKIGIKDNFFELGGNSLSAARIVSKIKKTIASELSVEQLYHCPRIYLLCQALKHSPKIAPAAETLSTLPRKISPLPLTEFQFLFWLTTLVEPKVQGLNIIGRKRLSGRLNRELLHLAFESVFHKHEILHYRSSTWMPALYLDTNFDFKIDNRDLSRLSAPEYEHELKASLKQLSQHRRRKKTAPLIKAHVFHLPDGSTELQICLSHIISDENSRDIIFSDLSDFYQAHQRRLPLALQSPAPFQDYIHQEINQINASLDQDLSFWRSYFQKADLFAFPRHMVTPARHKKDFSYSSYLELPEPWLKKLQERCQAQQKGITELICAALGLVLADYKNKNQNIVVNLVKSMREDECYDHTLGCFLRLDSVKINLGHAQDLTSLAEQIHQSAQETRAHQTCPLAVKLACLRYPRTVAAKAVSLLFKLFFKTFTKIFHRLKLNPEVLALYPHTLFLRSQRRFIININVLNGVFAANNLPADFGFEQKPLDPHFHDLCTIDNVLELCFFNHEKNKNYLVLSSNLLPQWREIIGKKIIETLS